MAEDLGLGLIRVILRENYLRVGDMSVVTNLSRYCKAELRRSDDILKIVNVHDGGDRSTGSSKEIENTAASFR